MSKAAKINQPTQASLDDLPEIDVTKARVLGRGLRKDRKLPLRALREAADKTQDEVASLAGMDQSEISRVEQRDDLRLSTLRRYARALDAEIEVVALLPTVFCLGWNVTVRPPCYGHAGTRRPMSGCGR